MSTQPTLLYCHCAHAKVVPDATRNAVLAALAASGRPFEAVADLCELSARKDPTVTRLVNRPGVQLIACHRRAVEWLVKAAGSELPKDVVVHNMRESTADTILSACALRAPAPAEEPAP